MFRQLQDALIGNNLISVNQDVTHPIEGFRQASIAGGSPSLAATAYQNAVTTDPTFQDFQRRYNLLPIGGLGQQLANLTATSLAGLPAATAAGRGLGGSLDSINLLSRPATLGKKRRIPADFYEADRRVPGGKEQRLTFSPTTGTLNPAQAFTHEGMHAMHDLYKAPHQGEMINFLAQEEARNAAASAGVKRNSWLQPLLEGSQALINEPSFTNNYTYSKTLNPNITKGFKNLADSKSFADAKGAITQDRTNGLPSGDAFMKSLSEFPAFMSERLGDRFAVPRDAAGVPTNDPARRFTKENLRTMYRDYDELSGGGVGGTPNSLATQYPGVHQAFFDQYNDLRNPNVVASPDPARQTTNLAAGKVIGAPKPPLTAYAPGIGGAVGTPNTFPAPKYTNRAKGGSITNKNLLSRFKNPRHKLI